MWLLLFILTITITIIITTTTTIFTYRAGVETVLKQAFEGLSDDLKGTYYELGGMSEETLNFLLSKGKYFYY